MIKLPRRFFLAAPSVLLSRFAVAGWLPVAQFSPLSLLGLQLWLKADTGTFTDAGVTPAINGQAIQQWNDQSGQGNHLTNTGTSTTRPTLDTVGYGTGKSGVKLTAANSQFINRSSIAFNSALATFVVVTKTTGAGFNNGRIFSMIGQGQANDFGNPSSFEMGAVTGNVATLEGFGNGGVLGNGGAAFAISFNAVEVIALVFNGTTATVYLNGIQQGAPTAFTGTLGAVIAAIGFGVRADGVGGEFWDGEMAEALLYSSALNTDQFSQLETYFQGRYGPF